MDLASDITPEDIEVFLQEAEEQLQLMDEEIVQLEREEDPSSLLQNIFRAAHTLKGSSAMLGYDAMTHLGHAMENLLDHLRDGSVEVSTGVIDALLGSLDVLKVMKEDLANGSDSNIDTIAVVAALERAAGDATSHAQGHTAPKAEVNFSLDDEQSSRMEAALNGGQHAQEVKIVISRDSSWASVRCFQVLHELSLMGEVICSVPSQEEVESGQVGYEMRVLVTSEQSEGALKQALQELSDLTEIEIGPYSAEDQGSVPAKAAPSGADPVREKSQQSYTVRVDVERLDALMNNIGELSIDRNRILQIGRQLVARYKDDELVRSLGETSAHVVKVVDDLQQGIMEVRMLPIGTVFNGFPRMVRDLAQKFNKNIDFVMDGQETEIDRTVIERIRDPLVHLLRNAVDHGIESQEVRKSAGKPADGTIRLSAFQEQGNIVVTVEDDGGGIDPNRMRKMALEKGILSAEAIARLTDAEAVDLVFLPGASTAKETTEVSGRGVGMDVVKANIEAINGIVTAETKLGKGTKFTLKLPLTLATLNTLLVSLDNTVYAVPMIYVLEALKLEEDDIVTLEGVEVTRLRGNVVPLIRGGTVCRKGGVGAITGTYAYAVVVKIGDWMAGLVVDSLIELQEIMVKSMAKSMGEIKGIAGVSVLGDGQVVLILDVPTLIQYSLKAVDEQRNRLAAEGARDNEKVLVEAT
ncbi:MAG: chemotaxis protein CheA [Chloroflexi bacterium]|nr:chemotaxis protein CheA [Chloroflexota bacterium]